MPFVLTRNQMDLLVTLGVIVGAALAGLIVHRLLFWALHRSWAARSERIVPAIIRRARRPLGFILPLIAVVMALPDAQVPPAYTQPVEHIAIILTFVAIGWGATAVVALFVDVTIARYKVEETDNLRARQLETRLFIVARALNSLIWVIAISAILMTFPAIRTLGATLLASAGLAGIVAGVAARPAIENMFAGLQLAFSQPIRIDDIVVVQNEFGRIEEITSTYVVVRVWDQRRLVVPLTYFIQTPFENWTRRTAELLGTVIVYAPYAFPVATLREALPGILKETPLWDGRIQALQVTDATEGAMQIRALVSARNAEQLWDLRCLVRERLVALIAERAAAK